MSNFKQTINTYELQLNISAFLEENGITRTAELITDAIFELCREREDGAEKMYCREIGKEIIQAV